MSLGRRILVPLDGSDFGERALPLATAIARQAGGELRLLSAYVMLLPNDAPPASVGLFADVEREARTRTEAYLDERTAELRESGVTVEAEVRSGPPDLEIIDGCAEAGCDLIAMATHGHSGFNRLWLGSVADRVVRRAEVPVLLISAAGRDEPSESASGGTVSDPPRDVRTVIIPLDGSSFSETALVPATALGGAFSAEYILYRAVAPPRLVTMPAAEATGRVHQQLLEEERATARRELEETAAKMRDAGYTVTVMVTEESEPAPALLRLAEATPDSVIAMTTHGRGALRRVVFGSVADKLIRASTRPILLIRPG